MNATKTLKSGREVKLQIASFELSMKLLKALVNEIKAVDLGDGFKIGTEVRLDKLAEAKDLPVDALKNIICQLLGSDTVTAAVRDCMASCQYGEVGHLARIVKDTFEAEEARGDYLPVAWEVIVLNVTPFFSGLDLKSLNPAKPPIASPQSG